MWPDGDEVCDWPAISDIPPQGGDKLFTKFSPRHDIQVPPPG